MDYRLSRFLSYILHPLLIPALVLSALLLQPDRYAIGLPNIIKFWFIAIIFVFTVIIPAGSVLLLLKFKVIHSPELNQRNERTIPLLIAGISYMGLLYFLRPTIIPPVFLYILYSAAFALLMGMVINLFYKISLHALGWGALTATLTAISIRLGTPMLPFILISTLLSGLAGSARLMENAHNQAQVYSGYIAGVFVVVLITFFS
jgi:hypothetical protein